MQWLRYAIQAILLVLGLASSAIYYDRYWRWGDCFNDLGRCWDPLTQDVYLEQAGLVWGGFATLFFGTALVLLLWRQL